MYRSYSSLKSLRETHAIIFIFIFKTLSSRYFFKQSKTQTLLGLRFFKLKLKHLELIDINNPGSISQKSSKKFCLENLSKGFFVLNKNQVNENVIKVFSRCLEYLF